MNIIKPLDAIVGPDPYIFLSGSIEMGTAEKWQEKVGRVLASRFGTLLNPRRDDWDDSWAQEVGDMNFRSQVQWELMGLDCADLVAVYFDPTTKSPVTLLELGLMAGAHKNMVVCCPEGFWKKGNVDLVCRKYSVHQEPNFTSLVLYLDAYIENFKP